MADIDIMLDLQAGNLVDDFRPFQLPISIQTMAAGKTTLAKNFVAQLSDANASAYMEDRIKEFGTERRNKLKAEWDQAKQAVSVPWRR